MSITKTIKRRKIVIGGGVNPSDISDYGLEVLADILQASNNNSCTITSGTRDQFNQARVMYEAIEIDGATYWKSKYASPGDAVIDVYLEKKKEGLSKPEVIQAMKEKIQEFLDKGIRVSRHMGDPNKLQVYDIAKSSIANKSEFVSAIQQSKNYYKSSNPKGTISHYIDENRAYHIEIPQTPGITSTGITSTSIPDNSPVKNNDPFVTKYVHPKGTGGAALSTLLNDPNFIGYDIPIEKAYEFSYQGKSNNRRMYEALDINSKKYFGENTTGDYNPNVLYPLVGGTSIYFPASEITIGKRKVRDDKNEQNQDVQTQRDLLRDSDTKKQGTPTSFSEIITYSSNISIQKTIRPTLFPYVLKRLSLDPGYIPAEKNRGVVAKDIYSQLSVTAWSKVLHEQQGDGFVNITKDIIRCDINSRMGGGDFTIEISPIVGFLSADNENGSRWVKKGFSEDINGENVSLHNINKERLFSDSDSIDGIGSEYVRHAYYYNMIFQQNDMIWIKFERLGIENQADLSENKFGEWYDMICLIDAVDTSISSIGSDVHITIRGRDLTKVLQDDNSYFNPYSIGHASSVYGDNPFENGRYVGGTFKELAAIQARTIQQSIEFIFHRIASIGYVPDFVLKDLQDPTIITSTKITKSGSEEKKFVKGLWQCFKVFIDDSIKDLKLIDDSISNPNGSIFDIIGKVCQDPFVEFFTDTYGDKFYLIARRPPFEKFILEKILDEIVSSDIGSDKISQSLRNTSRVNAYKEFLNKKSEKNKVALASASGVEVEDKKTIIKENNPQTNPSSIIDPSEEQLESLFDDIGGITNEFPLIINLNEDDVINDNLSFNNESYAWYQVTDRGNFAGASITLGHVPSLYFDDIAQIFGNKRLEVVSNYSNYKFFQSNRTEKEIDLYADQAAQHLAFLIETNIHLPFTRRGTITLNGGDRRIKKGNYIYYRPTKEVFYVTGVSHSINITRGGIDRNTRVEVDRGMKIQYIKGKIEQVLQEDGSMKEENVSYFSIVDIPKLSDGVRDAVSNGSANNKFDYKKNIKINKGVLNFFIQRRQFKQYE